MAPNSACSSVTYELAPLDKHPNPRHASYKNRPARTLQKIVMDRSRSRRNDILALKFLPQFYAKLSVVSSCSSIRSCRNGDSKLFQPNFKLAPESDHILLPRHHEESDESNKLCVNSARTFLSTVVAFIIVSPSCMALDPQSLPADGPSAETFPFQERILDDNSSKAGLQVMEAPSITGRLSTSVADGSEIETPKPSRLRYSEFLKAVDNNLVKKVEFSTDGSEAHVTLVPGVHTEVTIPSVAGLSTELAEQLVSKGVETQVESGYSTVQLKALDLLQNLVIPMFFLLVVPYLFIRSQLGDLPGPGGPLARFMNPTFQFQEEPQTGVKFDDVAGVDQAKLELQEVVDFLKRPDKYTALGAKLPRGCLLSGPPGSGKTLLARAVAGEAGLPFVSCSASEFVEVFVGVGASRIRALFETAKSKAPCLIFIDELDAVGRKRGAGLGGGNDEREQTINQLLMEMDGFSSNTGVIVLAATNRPDVLDDALLRPGRFDRRVAVDRPDLQGRVKILQVHARNKVLGPDVVLEKIARRTPGFTGADLQNLLNEAAILAARRGLQALSRDEVTDALEKIIAGPEKSSTLISEEKRWLVAVHEAGHAIVGALMPEYDPVEKISIIPRWTSRRTRYFSPDESRLESGLYSKRYLESQLAVALGGRVAEELVFGMENVTTGAATDLSQVSRIARMMVEECGFSKEVGQLCLTRGRQNTHLGGANDSEHSLRMADVADAEIRRLVAAAYGRATAILNTNFGLLQRVAEILVEKETLDGAELRALLLSVNSQADPI